ncbi:MAG: hypothetical protein HZB13_15255 [Acidobacteria bacterium]|nr:hypothetical protein [Acidobacteriota bacterium]
MKTLTTILVCFFLIAGVALAAAIDGKWVSERKMNRGGEEVTIVTTFDLKSDGAKLTGTMSMPGFGGGEPRTIEIKDGKIDGNKFSFKTTMSTPNGDFTSAWEGTVEGDTLKGTSMREGGQGQPRPFEAKRK